jgi:LysR family transcriptional activator of nhaA
MRRGLDRWLESHGVRPQVVAELADSALMSLFGERGEGVFPGPSAIERELREHYGVEVVGRAPELRERFYAITVERRIKNPAVQAISDAAREQVFR